MLCQRRRHALRRRLSISLAHLNAVGPPVPPPFEFEPARLDTERGLGGVTDLDILPALVGLQRSNHILHARGGTLAELPAERMELPLDPCGHTQRLGLFVAPDAERTIYASQCSVLSRSRDGGKTWWHTYREPVAAPAVPDNHFMHMRVLPDGMWIRVVTGEENGAERPTSLAPPRGQAVLTVSSDEGSSWTERACIGGAGILHGSSELLIGSIEADAWTVYVVAAGGFTKSDGAYTELRTVLFKSEDGGCSFNAPTSIGQWGHETNLTVFSPSHLFATIRYQPLTQDLAAQGDDAGMTPTEHAELLKANAHVSKVVFVTESTDGGMTFSKNRQVTTGGGQCHGHSVRLRDGKVVMVSDHRYPRPVSGARAFVSPDGGTSWNDEVYYLNNGAIGGFARTISLDGCEMLTLTGYIAVPEWASEADTPSWDNGIGVSVFDVIRWSLVE